MDLSAGHSLGRYEIRGYLGAGGMGVVYRARDAQLGREVAVKVLNDRAAGDPSRVERFVREARAVARLSHPNILDIHDFGNHEGIVYTVTELLRGHTLEQRIARSPIPLQSAFKVCRAIAEGLAAAHGEGIVHRDIKPSNIFITDDGQVKILDFGIASLREESVEDSRPGSQAPTETSSGSSRMAGTVGYMSPEQVEGRAVDGRSDIFGLGCVMYEVLTGRRAFRGTTPTETMLAILGKDPEPIRLVRPEIPLAVEMVVRRCLEKQPGERFESARDVAFALQALADSRDTGSDPGGPRSGPSARRRRGRRAIVAVAAATVVVAALLGLQRAVKQAPAVLPQSPHIAVVDISAPTGDPALQELAAGLTETVSSSLRLLERQTHGVVWVLPRRHHEAGVPWTAGSTATMHGVNLVLGGRLSSSDGRLVMEIELRDPFAASLLRTAVVADATDNLISFQHAPLQAVASMLEVEPDPVLLTEFRAASTKVVPAFTAYLSGIGRLARASDRTELVEARACFEEAAALDPTFGPAREGELLACAALIGNPGEGGHEVSCEDWLLQADRQPSADVLAAAAAVYRAAGDAPRAAQYQQRALEQRPDDAELLLRLGRDLQAIERLEAAESAFHGAIDRRPDFWEGHYYLGYLEYVRGNYQATANAWRTAARCAPRRASLYSNLGAVFHVLDRRDEARRMLERAVEVSGGSDYVALANLGIMYFEDARFAEAASTFRRALALDDSDYELWGGLAWSYASGVDAAKAEAPFRRAAELAAAELARTPDDPTLAAQLAGYYGMLGERDRGLELIETAIRLQPQDPIAIATIGETLEDLGDRERALEWIGRALRRGVPRSRFESHPSLRGLVADERYQRLVTDPSPPADLGSS
jgi:serine/threonine protein kinase/tetratricopeptide (TPR) repeat protein